MQFSRVYRKLKGFTLIESMLGLMVIGLVSGSIMLGITTVEKKLFKINNDIKKLIEMIKSGKIIDSKTICAVMIYAAKEKLL